MGEPYYTHEEEKKIVDYIIEHNAFSMNQEDVLYKNMTNESIGSYGWHCLKRHFLTKVMGEIYLPRYKLSCDTLEKFYRYFNDLEEARKNRKMEVVRQKCRCTQCMTELIIVNSDSDSEVDLSLPSPCVRIGSRNIAFVAPAVVGVTVSRLSGGESADGGESVRTIGM